MTITLKFKGTEITQSNPKSARAWLRRNGMNVRQCVKQGDTWKFDFTLSDKVSYNASAKIIPQKKPKPKIVPNVQRVPRPQEQVAALPKLHKPKREITNTPVLGKDLCAGDMIINFAEFYDLTIDHRGIHEIVVPATDLTRVENRFTGFYSVESGGLLSYRIDLEATYDVIRGEA